MVTVLTYITIFLLIFAILSIINVIFNFIKALLSNPPQKISLERSALIYYGICMSYIITYLITQIQ